MVEIKRERKNSSTEITVIGSLIEVFEQIQDEFIAYDARGYSTKVQSISMNMDGSYVARIWRANSCD